ncbi:enhancer of mRNA-decapping protein 3, partial [Lecanoromycetidae sp. Uapishka_2]
MAEAFIGLRILVTLKDPPGAKVRGLVIAVAEQQLTLNKVAWLNAIPQQSERLVVPGGNISDIDVEADSPIPESKEGFVDPAIVSYDRLGAPEQPVGKAGELNGVPSSKAEAVVNSQIRNNAHHDPDKVSSQPFMPIDVSDQDFHPTSFSKHQSNAPTSATLTAPFNQLSLNGHGLGVSPAEDMKDSKVRGAGPTTETTTPIAQAANHTKQRQRKPRQSQGIASTQAQAPAYPDTAVNTASTQKRRNNKQKGWRQTPLLTEPNTANDHVPRSQLNPDKSKPQEPDIQFTPAVLSQSQGRRLRYKEEDNQNGWATEDATDIQDMGDFDFAQNLSKFDKRKVFDQIRQDDTTADEARLVSHNRLGGAKSGTAGGRNLHFTESVLESPTQKAVVHSSESEPEVGAINMSRTSTRTSVRKGPSRKGSAQVGGEHRGSESTFVNQVTSRTRHSRATSPKVSNRTDSSTSRLRRSSTTPAQSKPSLRLHSSNRTCPCVSPLQMLELEQLAMSELGLSEEAITENAARCIAETAYTVVTLAIETDIERSRKSPLLVLLAGNHRTGSRTIAAARHLLNHGARVVLCFLGPLEREDELLDSVRRQLKIFRNCGGHAIKQDGLMRTLRQLQAPTDLIIDALFGMHTNFEDLRTDEQASYFQLMCWANGSEANILSVDVPSGIDASSGVAAEHDEQSLGVHASRILSLGAPKTGLLTALSIHFALRRASLCVADIGIGAAAWKKLGNRRRHGVEFRGKWVAELEYHDGSMT